MEAEHARRQQEAAERQAELQRRVLNFYARLATALGGDAPSLNDIELATRLTPNLRDAGMQITWREFGDEDPRACAELCKRLTQIARSELPDPREIRRSIAIAVHEWEQRHRRDQDERPPPSAAPVSAEILAAKKRELHRQKVMRFVIASFTDDDRKQRVNGLCGFDPAHDEQWWLDTCDAERQLANWDQP
jgi:hypothetical protein